MTGSATWTDEMDLEEKAKQYSETEALLSAGEYMQAIEAFRALGNYKDSTERLAGAIEANNAEKYAAAETLLSRGEYTQAVEAFRALGNYKDSTERRRPWRATGSRTRCTTGRRSCSMC